MSTTTTKITAPSLLTEDTLHEVSEALLRHATRNYAGAVLVEDQGIVPPIAPEHVTYRLGTLEVEELGWSAGGAKVSQRIDLWVPEAPAAGSSKTPAAGAAHATLGAVESVDRQARLSDGTTVITGTYSVEVFPHVPLIEERSEQVARLALSDRHRQREVGKVGPVEGTPERRSQRVEMGVLVLNSAHHVMDELRGSNTSAGHVSDVEVIGARMDHVGSGSFATATPSYDRKAVQLAVSLTWREK
ncbi:hypothetical protein CFK38_06240 [Brachybacterium vulturis]|uniref:Uncharacterized protein n=1 Tax=Brachybacterium vulturis TaxID=2017484 RepID=A0A291GLU9_9MICO|nr:hypothetical protein [Brachybacterium vulturis]ATG51168.1 hypothetical protein CFK38_06240 [Brachybacterium vulturis]